ncbi:hypothetical protein [Ralstonia pseudosolanacearum]|uniref:hypothetical protein n=1 Tax=Ralstonia pseudosolanacearum TaxID=1310165 RepID=UPI003CEA4CEC
MLHSATFWRRYFNSMFKPHLERTLDVLKQRLLPTFDGIEAEATALQEKTYLELVSSPFDPDTMDESMLAEAAFEVAYKHYSEMDSVRQALVNSFAPMLYHTWEQQSLAFHRKEVLHPVEEQDNRLLQVKALQTRLMDEGFDITLVPA